MERPTPTELRIGDWRVNPAAGEISRNGETIRLEARTMRLLLCLAERAGEVVSIEDLLSQVWPGVIVTPDSVYQAVASLRRLLGDDSKQPTYIVTVPRQGYRMVAAVSPWEEGSAEARVSEDDSASSSPRTRTRGFSWAAAVVCLALITVSLVVFRSSDKGSKNGEPEAATTPDQQRSLAVLPFLDLTEGMTEETFADGMTEELIDKLSKIYGLRVPSATSSFYFKGKQLPVAEIAKNLDVSYVLDGSVRKSGTSVRVAARLLRVDNGYVIWSETYDRPWKDIVMVQDDIATEVTKALRPSIEHSPGASAPR
jgi:transcriptional activator of cad operon